MKHLVTIAIIFIVTLPATKIKAQTSEDSVAIQAILHEEVDAWNNGDAIAYSKHFSEQGTFTNIKGMFFIGHKKFLERHVEIFKGLFHKTVLQQEIASFRFLSPDVAIVETLTWISGFAKDKMPQGLYIDSKGRLHTRLLHVFQKNVRIWQIVSYHNVDVKADAPIPEH